MALSVAGAGGASDACQELAVESGHAAVHGSESAEHAAAEVAFFFATAELV